MKNKKIFPVSIPHIHGNEIQNIIKTIKDGWISSEGPVVKKFENEFSKFCNRKYGVSVSSGTAAIDIAIRSLNLKKDDEVIMPTFTIISCIKEILSIGAKPILVDADPKTWCLDVDNIENKISKKTKAILIVHIYGMAVDADPVLKLAKKYKLKVIEDAAESHGMYYKNNICGSIGDISTFSFYSNKNITTGEGGMILTNNKILYERFKELRNLSFNNKNRFIHKELSWNYRLTSIQAAFGLAQLHNIDFVLKKKKILAMYYYEKLSKYNFIKLQPISNDYCHNSYWVFGVLINKNLNMKLLLNKLNKAGIGVRRFFYPMHKQPVFKKYFQKKIKLPISENLYKRGLYLPLHTKLNKKDIDFITNKFISLIK